MVCTPSLTFLTGSDSELAKGICRQTDRRRYTQCLTAVRARGLHNVLHAVLRDGVHVQLSFNTEFFIAFIRPKYFLIFYRTSNPNSRRISTVFTAKTSHLMLSRKIVGVASDNDKRHKYVVRENEAFFKCCTRSFSIFKSLLVYLACSLAFNVM
jgi:hypothetical protein